MSLIINKVISCSTQINYNYFESDLLFGYDIVGTYQINFADVTFTNDDGVLYAGIEALRQAYLRPNLTARIGSDEFTNGRITSQSFEQSFLVGDSICTVSIEGSERLNDYSSNEFAQHIPSPQLISSFQEKFNFTRSGDNYTSTRNTSITYKQDAGDQFLTNAKSFLVNTYFNNRPNLGYQVDGISENGRFDGGFRPLINETIDLLNLTVSLQETLQASFIDNDHSRRQTYSIDVGEDGYTTKKYTVEVRALKEPLEQVALDACKDILTEIAAANLAEFNKPIEIAKGINRDGGVITLNITFSNDPKLNSDQTTSYTVTKSRSNSEFYDYSITMDITASGKNIEDKKANVRSAWSSIVSTYPVKIASLFAEATGLFEKSRDYNFSSKEPKISDTAVYTKDDSYNTAGDILKDETIITTNFALIRQRVFVSPSTRGEVVEIVPNLASVGSLTTTRNIVAKMSLGMRGLIDYLDALPSNANISDTVTANFESSGSRVIVSAITEL